MGRDLAHSDSSVALLYEQAKAIVGYDLASVCFSGPIEQLDTTEFSQPALYVTSVACLQGMRSGRFGQELAEVKMDACLGLSLGEYTALHASGAVPFDEGLRLVQLRGQSMQAAAEQSHGRMVSVLGMDEESVNQLCRTVLDDICCEAKGTEDILLPVNFNCPGQIVVSGTAAACERLVQLAEERSLAKVVPLRVRGGFHTQMMSPAVEQLGLALAQCKFRPMHCQVVANVDARPYDGTEHISEKLLRQLVEPVRWQQSIETLLEKGFGRFVEIGPGRVLTGLVKRICRARKCKVELVNAGELT